MPAYRNKRLRLMLASTAVVGIAVVGAASARSADGETPFDEMNAKLDQLTAQTAHLSSSTDQVNNQLSALDAKLAELNAKVAQLDEKIGHVDSRTIDISTDVQLLKQLANSTHDRLNATCTLVLRAESWAYISTGLPGVPGETPASCWRNWWNPATAAIFSSRWADPIPAGVPNP
jgi:septal ring factor EnvC (AmiA/AmiB activator)